MPNSSPLRIVFAGTPEFAAVALRALLDSPHRVCAVYTQPDRPAGRGRRLQASPVKQLALAHAIPVQQPASLKTADTQQALRAYQADVMVVAAYGLLLPPEVLTLPRLGCLNIHASLLPRWRGAAPIQRAILAGDRETGVTIMQMNAGLDTGDIILSRTCPILPDDTAGTLHDRLAVLGAQALLEALEHLQRGGVTRTPQDERLACYAPKIEKAEAVLDWRQDAALLERKVRAFNPWPVAHTTLADGRVLRVWRARALPAQAHESPGTVIAANKDGVDVATGHGVLRLEKMQLPGGRVLEAGDFINACRIQGQKLGAQT